MSSNSAGPSQASTDGYEKYEPLVNFDRRTVWYHPGHANAEDIQTMVNDVLALARDLPRLGGSLVGSVTGLRMVEPALLDQVNGLQEALEVLANTVIGGASTRAHSHGVSDSGLGEGMWPSMEGAVAASSGMEGMKVLAAAAEVLRAAAAEVVQVVAAEVVREVREVSLRAADRQGAPARKSRSASKGASQDETRSASTMAGRQQRSDISISINSIGITNIHNIHTITQQASSPALEWPPLLPSASTLFRSLYFASSSTCIAYMTIPVIQLLFIVTETVS